MTIRQKVKKILGIRVYGQWQVIGQDYFEEMRGAYIPYIVQKRQCIWSGHWQIEVTTSKNNLHYQRK